MNRAEAAAAAWHERLCAGIDEVALRAECDADLPFLRVLYASTREAELAPVPWTAEQKSAFLAEQFALQHEQYRRHYVGADFLVITRAEAAIGRLYLHRTAREVRLMDVALLPSERGAGLGTRLMDALARCCDAHALPLTLHVEPFNPAYRLYRRLGCAYRRTAGAYHFLERMPGAPRDVVALSAWPRRLEGADRAAS